MMKKHLIRVHIYLYCIFFLLPVSALETSKEALNKLLVASSPQEIDDTVAVSPDPGWIEDSVAMPPDTEGIDTLVPDTSPYDALTPVIWDGGLSEGTSESVPGFADPEIGKFNTSIRVVVAIASSIALLLFIFGFIFWKRHSKKLQQAKQRAESGVDDITINPESLEYSLSEIETATNNFSAENAIGQGGFGSVYKGKLPNGEEIAVKRLSRRSGQGTAEFKNEIAVVAKLQHRNLVRLLGFCLEDEEKILVYEFVPKRSLDYFLFDPEQQGLLKWSTRRDIIGGIARGLVYLHEDSRLKVVHRDLKAGNILLDEGMHPKIADFGMAKIFGIHGSQGNTNRIAGTFGYMAPEYIRRGQYSEKSDVFSFGVVILEIVMGRKNSSFHQSEDFEDLISHVWKQWRNGTALDILDPSIRESFVTSEAIQCIHIGLLCVEKDANKRPTMASVVYMLNTTSSTLPINPYQPAVHGDYVSETQPLDLDLELGSIDEASFTELYPR